MTQDSRQSYRAVLCKYCRQPIPVPATMETAELEPHERQAAVRVFSLRCRACEKERPYHSTAIVEFDGVPRSRDRVHPASAVAAKPSDRSRAANA
jgi:hypothetical protein